MITYSFTKHAYKQLEKFPINVQRYIVEKIKFYISTDNPLHYADHIEGKKGKVYRFRTGDYRVIFDWERNNILITKIAPRPKAY